MRAIIFLAIAAFILTGCFQVAVVQEISADGVSTMTTTITMAAPNETGLENQANPCDDAPEGVNCSFNPQTNTATYISQTVLNESVFVREQTPVAIRYTLTQLSTGQELEDLTADFEGNESTEMLSMMGFEATHTVIMPAPIVSTTVGEIIDTNQVRINLLQVPSTIEIVAEEENRAALLAMSIFLGIILVIILAFVGLKFYKKYKQNAVLEHSPAEVKRGETAPVSHIEKKYRDYILQYKNQHNRADIKNALLQAGLSDELAERYLTRYYK